MNRKGQSYLFTQAVLLVLCTSQSPSIAAGRYRFLPAENSRSTPRQASFTEADFARHVELLKRKLPSGGFTIVVQTPFVVIGDESEEAVKRHARDTIKWAVDKLKQDYFSRDPKEILDIWLFKDAESYERNTRRLFGEKPGTPYGYYSSAHRALIMNISTGGGTLVHEIVHPFIEANFPACPPWFKRRPGIALRTIRRSLWSHSRVY